MSTTSESISEQLAECNFQNELLPILSRTFKGEQFLGKPRDVRVDVEPYHDLIELYGSAPRSLKERLTCAFRQFLTHPYEHLDDAGLQNLLRVLQDCGAPLADELERIARRGTYLAHSKDMHALALKCLISLESRQTPQFWNEQLKILGSEYGAVIFNGLIQHGLEIGFSLLPQLTNSKQGARQIALALPSLIDEFGYANVKKHLRRVIHDCSDSAQHLMCLANPDLVAGGDSASPISRQLDSAIQILPGARVYGSPRTLDRERRRSQRHKTGLLEIVRRPNVPTDLEVEWIMEICMSLKPDASTSLESHGITVIQIFGNPILPGSPEFFHPWAEFYEQAMEDIGSEGEPERRVWRLER